MQQGIMDRFRSLPMTCSSVLLGRQVSEIARNMASIVVMLILGYLVGFRLRGTILQTLAAFGLLISFGFAFSWLAAVIGLTARSPAAAQGAGLFWLFPFTFISGAFVPTETMPGWLQLVARNSPITAVVYAMRAWFGGQGAAAAGWQALGWTICVTAVFMPLAISRFRRRDT
jgi:ABC-2 type transport system permease protein/oleandomycin transport system permease protein